MSAPPILTQVEALESGVFRSDLPCKFRCKPEAYQVGHDCLGHNTGWKVGWLIDWKNLVHAMGAVPPGGRRS